MSPDAPTKALRTEMESRFKSANAEIAQCRSDLQSWIGWCSKCQQERCDAETTIVAATNKLAEKTAAFQKSITEYIKTANKFIEKSLTLRTGNGRK